MFYQKAGESPQRLGKVRWFTFFEVAAQILKHFEVVLAICHDNTAEFAEEIRFHLQQMTGLPQETGKLQVELALLKDSASGLCKFCYHEESDEDLLCVQTYDHWEAVRNDLISIAVHRNYSKLHETMEVISKLGLVGEVKSELLKLSIEDKILPVVNKMIGDSSGRLSFTLNVFMGCRLFNYRFVGATPLITLRAIEVQLQFIPAIDNNTYETLRCEIPELKNKADFELQHDSNISFWDFFVKYKLFIPNFYKVACESIALFTPSSASCERVLATYTESFADNQGRAYSDLREATVLLKVNEKRRNKEREKMRSREELAKPVFHA
jgi:hypothetical protein